MPHPARTRSFGRQMTRTEFAASYRAELQEVQSLRRRGVDTSRIERDIQGAVSDFRADKPVRTVRGLRSHTDGFDSGRELRELRRVTSG